MSKNPFYDTGPWRQLRKKVLRDFKCECQICRNKPGKPVVRATIVHHIFHLEDYPEWGLMEFVPDPVTGEPVRNLLPVCKDCHETVCHPERLRRVTERKAPLTEEKW